MIRVAGEGGEIVPIPSEIILKPEYLTGKDATAWQNVVSANLRQVAASKTGGCVLRQLQRNRHLVTIKPYYDDEPNAGSIPVNERAAYYKYRPVRFGSVGLVIPEFHRGIGTGTGTDVVVRFTPWRYGGPIQAATLVHEFVHVAEMELGVFFANAIGWNFRTTAEFDAILVANIYRSETGLPRVRSHDRNDPPATSYNMIPQMSGLKKLIASFKARMPLLTSDLAQVNTAFNPLRKGAGGYVDP